MIGQRRRQLFAIERNILKESIYCVAQRKDGRICGGKIGWNCDEPDGSFFSGYCDDCGTGYSAKPTKFKIELVEWGFDTIEENKC